MLQRDCGLSGLPAGQQPRRVAFNMLTLILIERILLDHSR